MSGLAQDEDCEALAAAARSKGATDHRDPDDAGDGGEGSPLLSAAPRCPAPGCSDALAKRLAAHPAMALRAMLDPNTTVCSSNRASVAFETQSRVVAEAKVAFHAAGARPHDAFRQLSNR